MQLLGRLNWSRRALVLAGAVILALSVTGCLEWRSTDSRSPAAANAMHATAVLPSWRDGTTKSNIVKFVADVTREGSSTFVPQADRIAVFDNDGTLWSEQPLYFQFLFLLDQIKLPRRTIRNGKTTPPIRRF